MHFPQLRGEHCVHSWVLHEVLGQLRPARWALLLTMVDPLFEALEAEVMLASGCHGPFAQLQANTALQVLQVLLTLLNRKFSVTHPSNMYMKPVHVAQRKDS